MFEIGKIVGFDPDTGWPLVRLEDGTEPRCQPPKQWSTTTTSAGTPAHTHGDSVGVLVLGDDVGVIPIKGRARTEFAILNRY